MTRSRKSVDPVFALIAQHREAEKVRSKASLKLGQIRKRLEKKDGSRADTVYSLMNAFPPMTVGLDSVVKFAGNIPSHVEGALHKATRELGPKTRRKLWKLGAFAEEELQVMYRRHMRGHIQAQKAFGIESALTSSGDAVDRSNAALLKLTTIKPRTTQGAVALLDYFGDLVERGVLLHGNFLWAGKPMRDLALRFKTAE
jgi:hypothetical protein